MNIKELYNNNEPITLNSYLEKCGVKDIKDFLEPSGKYLDNCLMYHNMLDAVQMFKYHCLQNDGAYILCDSGDTDGITSAVIMFQYMKALNSDWDIEILLHSGKQRGLQDEELFKKVMEEPKGLLIIPDSGTNDYIEVDQIYDLTNTNVLVLDHHNLVTPITKGILVNNQDELSNVSKNGSGCLVTHKFLEALDKEFNNNWSSWFIDIVALSLVSDSMAMCDEQNRTYYHYGLETIDCINNEFLRAMLNKFIGDKEYTQRDISFKIIPKINSICRSKDQELKQRVIMAFLGYDDIDEVLELCANAHKNQIDTVNNIIDANIGKIEEITDNKLIVFSCDDMPRSYSGLIAGKIMNLCGGKPTIVGKVINGDFIGSLRSPIPLQEDLDNNELVDWARGHSESCGVSIPSNNIQPLVDYYNTLEFSYEPCIQVLKSYSVNSIPNRLFGLFEPYNELWGNNMPQPTYHITLDYTPNDIKVMGKAQTTLKISKDNVDIIFFFMSAEKKEQLGLICNEDNKWISKDNKKRSLEIIGALGINRWTSKGGKTYINNQIIVDSFEVNDYKRKTMQDLF